MQAAKPLRWRHIVQKYATLVGEDPFEAEVNTLAPEDFDYLEATEKGDLRPLGDGTEGFDEGTGEP